MRLGRGFLTHGSPRWRDGSGAGSRAELSVPAGTLAAASLVAGAFPAWGLLRALYLNLHFEPTDTALYAARVGRTLGPQAGTAFLVLLAIAVGTRWISPEPTPALTVGVATAIIALLGWTAAAWVSADRALNPFGPETKAIAAFTPLPGARHSHDTRRASDEPMVRRSWRVPGTVEAACAPAVERLRAWADSGSVVASSPPGPTTCSYRGTRGRHSGRMAVFASTEPPGTVVLSLEIRRDRRDGSAG